MSTNYRVLSVVAWVALVLVSIEACAEVVNVDFQAAGYGGAATFSGQGGIAATGNTWNAVSPPSFTGIYPFPEYGGLLATFNSFTVSNLVDSTGAATGVSVTVDAERIWQQYDPLGNISTTDAADLMRDYLDINSVPRTVAINGLIAGGKYDLALYGEGNGLDRTTTFTVGAQSATTTGSESAHALTLGVDYVLLSGVVADSAGTISIVATRIAASSAFNGLQIRSVPEPGTLVLAATGLIGLLACAWRKRR